MNVEINGQSIPRMSRREIGAFVRTVLLTLRKDDEITDVSIAFVDDSDMKSLNRKFRHRNRTTDVLTFPADETYGDPNRKGKPLGDIVISIEQARRQAIEERHSLATEVRYLLVHGVLHALGYDHETDNGEMNELELDVREAVGL
jgi:probable rRNA maturation factor